MTDEYKRERDAANTEHTEFSHIGLVSCPCWNGAYDQGYEKGRAEYAELANADYQYLARERERLKAELAKRKQLNQLNVERIFELEAKRQGEPAKCESCGRRVLHEAEIFWDKGTVCECDEPSPAAPREWWIDPTENDESEDCEVRQYDAFNKHPGQSDLFWQAQLIHVIEKSAYDALKAECEKLADALKFAGCICEMRCGNPMVSEHSSSCVALSEALTNYAAFKEKMK